MLNDTFRRAVIAIANRIAAGIRTTVASRSFWSQFGFPQPDVRRELQRRAVAISKVNATVNEGGVSGTLADLYAGQGLPATDLGGGPLDTGSATVYARVPFVATTFPGGVETTTATFKTVKLSLPWTTYLHELDSLVADVVEEMSEQYGIGSADVGGAVYSIY